MVIAVPVVGKQKSVDICKAFIEGAPKTTQGRVFYGVNDSNVMEWDIARKTGTDWFYIDNSFFDSTRGVYFRVTKNCVQINPRGHLSDGKRFAALGLEIKPWQVHPDGHYLVIEQSPDFMRNVAQEPKWFDETVDWCRDTGRRTIIRRWSPNKPKQAVTLKEAMQGAKAVVTHSSAAAVTALLEGVPAIVEPMSALAFTTCSPKAENDERLWLMQVLADAQFTLDEIRSGKAWRWLNKS
ncbi:MAG: hypothetical protein ABIP06_06460 [Pyrinomonadaceae bacterium]